MCKNKLFLLFSIFVFSQNIKGQMSQELSLGFGLNQLIGDVGINKLQLIDGSRNLNYRNQSHSHYAFHIGLSQGGLYADDRLSNYKERIEKNIVVRSLFQSINTRLEIDYFPQLIPSYKFQQTPYIFGGVGLMSFTPQGKFGLDWIDLQPLGTEGQGTILSDESPYSTRAWTLPFGVGWRAQLNNVWVVSVEANWNLTTSDYLDDTHNLYVDQIVLENERGSLSSYFSNPSDNIFIPGTPRGNPQNNDSYFTCLLYTSPSPRDS